MMKKVDKILKRADVFEKLANCESKSQIKKVLAQYTSEPEQLSSEQLSSEQISSEPNASYEPPNASYDISTKNTPQKFQAPASLTNKNDVLKFQQNLAAYVKTDPSFNAQLTQALGGVPWGQGGKNKDIDGIAGARTMKAWNFYKQYAGSSNPNVNINTKREEAVANGSQLLNQFRDKLRVMRQKIAENTDNFIHPKNIGSDKVKEAWMPFLQTEYNPLYGAYQTYPKELQDEFKSLSQYMMQLFGAYMKAPPVEPKSLIDIDAVEYTPTEI